MFEALAAEFTEPLAMTTWPVVFARLSLALLLGAAVGWEREAHSKPAGLRTHMMVTIAACLFTILGYEIVGSMEPAGDHVRLDPIRIIEAVTSGVAFLAAGIIFMDQDKVRGLTTGASLWLAGAIGVACGIGRLSLALLATALSLTILWLVRRMFSGPSPKKTPR